MAELLITLQLIRSLITRLINGVVLVFFVVALSLSAAGQGIAKKYDNFDYYVLSLSWSPEYCAENRAKSPGQCNANYGFVVHGLWPQYHDGRRLINCNTPNRWLSEQIISKAGKFMPDRNLIIHQWRKHGSCSGLSPHNYFAAIDRAFSQLNIPPPFDNPKAKWSMTVGQLERKFIASNQGLKANMIAITCDDDNLIEVRICLDKQLRFFDCPRIRGCWYKRKLEHS